MLESLPYPLSPEQADSIVNSSDKILGIDPVVISQSNLKGTYIPAMVIRTENIEAGVVKSNSDNGYRILHKGENALSQVKNWCDQNGYE